MLYDDIAGLFFSLSFSRYMYFSLVRWGGVEEEEEEGLMSRTASLLDISVTPRRRMGQEEEAERAGGCSMNREVCP